MCIFHIKTVFGFRDREKTAFDPLVTRTPLQPSSRPLQEDNPAWGASPDLILPVGVPSQDQHARVLLPLLAAHDSASLVRQDQASSRRLELRDIRSRKMFQTHSLVVRRWRHVLCGAVRLRGEDGRRPVVQKRGSLPDYQQHVSVLLCVVVISLFSGLTVRLKQSGLMFSSNGPSVKSLHGFLFFCFDITATWHFSYFLHSVKMKYDPSTVIKGHSGLITKTALDLL